MLKHLREYLTLGSLATVASVVGIAGGANALFGSHGGGGGGGGGGGLPGAMTYVPQDQAGADTDWQTLLSHLTGAEGSQFAALMPFLTQMFSSGAAGIPGMQGRLTGYGDRLEGQAGTAYGAAGGLRAAGGQMWADALDPQNALRDRTQQRVVEGARGADSARGIAMGGVSSGNEGQAVSNFNLDWNDRQLGREATGMHGLTSAYDSAGRYDSMGNADLAGASSMFQGSMALPFNFANLFSGAMNNGIYQPAGGIQSQIGSYLGLGQSGANSAFGQQQTNLNNLTTGISQFGNSPGMGWLQNFFGPAASGGSGASSTVDNTTWGGA